MTHNIQLATLHTGVMEEVMGCTCCDTIYSVYGDFVIAVEEVE